jgi:hypothetical protein
MKLVNKASGGSYETEPTENPMIRRVTKADGGNGITLCIPKPMKCIYKKQPAAFWFVGIKNQLH